METVYALYLAISRWVLPLLSCLLVFLWIRYFRLSRPPRQTVARFVTREGDPSNLYAQEGLIGRSKHCDILLPLPTVEKRHAVVYQKKGNWWIASLGGEVWVNEEYIEEETILLHGDMVAIAEQELMFECNDLEEEDVYSYRMPSGALALIVLTVFQLVMGGQLCLRFLDALPTMLPICFGALVVGQWIYFAATRLMHRPMLLAELPILYLVTLGTAVCACATPDVLLKQLFCIGVGVVGCLCLAFLLRYHEFCYGARYVFALITVGVMAITVVFGTRIYGARNWLSIGSYSFQPSEFAKVALLLVGGCCLYVSLTKWKNRWFFLFFCAAVMGTLVLMVDFGAIAIFFVTMLVILLMRMTDWRLVTAIGLGAVAAGTVVLLLYPHIANRFSVWTNVWQYASSTGYQQTRTMIAAASGGLLGVGGGNGTLLSVAAADTDLVFGVLCEEWGGIIALCAAMCFVALGFYAVRLARFAACGFYATTVCGAAVMMLFQTALNIFGSTDLLPLTGVTMMFVSRGGTSLIAAFLLLAFFKAAERPACGLETERRRYY